MCLLTITKVSDAGERCWGVVLVDGDGVPILRSEKGVRKAEVVSVAKVLKFEGPSTPVIEEGKGREENGPVWSIEKAGPGWIARFSRVRLTSFELLSTGDDVAGSSKAAAEAVEAGKRCLAKVEIKWDPPEADPAYDEKETDETEIEGLPGS